MRRYWRFVVPAAAVVVLLGALLLNLNSNLVYFNTPTELLELTPAAGDRLRLGGQVEAGTVVSNGSTVEFSVTDGRASVPVSHRGAPPELFAEGTGVVVEGTWDGLEFSSDTMLIKHDEQYRTEDGRTYESGEVIEP